MKRQQWGRDASLISVSIALLSVVFTESHLQGIKFIFHASGGKAVDCHSDVQLHKCEVTQLSVPTRSGVAEGE